MNDSITSDLSDGWCAVPPEMTADVRDKKVSLLAQHIYIVIRGNWGGYPKVFPKQTTIAEKAGVSPSAVEKAIRQLKQAGWLMSQRQKISHGQNRYWICNKPFQIKPSKDAAND